MVIPWPIDVAPVIVGNQSAPPFVVANSPHTSPAAAAWPGFSGSAAIALQ